MLSAIIQPLATALANILEWLINCFLEALSISELEKYLEVFPLLSDVYTYLQSIAVALAAIVGGKALATFAMASVDKGRADDNPWMVLVKTFAAVSLIYWGGYILSYIVHLGSIPYAKFLGMNAIKVGDGIKQWGVGDFLGTLASAASIAAGGIIIPGASLAYALLELFVLAIIGWNLFKLVVEVCERWLMVGVLVFTSPLAYSTIPSNGTSQIFKRWVSMFIGSVIQMSLSVLFLKLILSGFSSNSTNFILKMLMILAMCKIVQRVDSYLQQLGIGAPTTGGGMVDDLLAGYHALRKMSMGQGGRDGEGGSRKSILGGFAPGSNLRAAARAASGAFIKSGGSFKESAAAGWNAYKLNFKDNTAVGRYQKAKQAQAAQNQAATAPVSLAKAGVQGQAANVAVVQPSNEPGASTGNQRIEKAEGRPQNTTSGITTDGERADEAADVMSTDGEKANSNASSEPVRNGEGTVATETDITEDDISAEEKSSSKADVLESPLADAAVKQQRGADADKQRSAETAGDQAPNNAAPAKADEQSEAKSGGLAQSGAVERVSPKESNAAHAEQTPGQAFWSGVGHYFGWTPLAERENYTKDDIDDAKAAAAANQEETASQAQRFQSGKNPIPETKSIEAEKSRSGNRTYLGNPDQNRIDYGMVNENGHVMEYDAESDAINLSDQAILAGGALQDDASGREVFIGPADTVAEQLARSVDRRAVNSDGSRNYAGAPDKNSYIENAMCSPDFYQQRGQEEAEHTRSEDQSAIQSYQQAMAGSNSAYTEAERARQELDTLRSTGASDDDFRAAEQRYESAESDLHKATIEAGEAQVQDCLQRMREAKEAYGPESQEYQNALRDYTAAAKSLDDYKEQHSRNDDYYSRVAEEKTHAIRQNDLDKTERAYDAICQRFDDIESATIDAASVYSQVGALTNPHFRPGDNEGTRKMAYNVFKDMLPYSVKSAQDISYVAVDNLARSSNNAGGYTNEGGRRITIGYKNEDGCICSRTFYNGVATTAKTHDAIKNMGVFMSADGSLWGVKGDGVIPGSRIDAHRDARDGRQVRMNRSLISFFARMTQKNK